MDTKEKILTAASALFLEGGMAALSVRAIAKRAGLSTIGIYSHYQGKQGILDALYIEGFEKVNEAMAVAPIAGEPAQTVLAAACGYLDVAENFEAHYRLIFGQSSHDYTPSEAAQGVANEAFARLVRGTAQLLPKTATADEKRAAALKIWALLHGFVSLKHHVVKGIMPDNAWRGLMVEAMEAHIQALLKDAK